MRLLSLAASATLLIWGVAQAQQITTTELNALDTDGDGSVNQSEFSAFLEAAFTRLDSDGDGAIGLHESQEVMTPEQFGAADTDDDLELTPSEFNVAGQADFSAADTDGDGRLN